MRWAKHSGQPLERMNSIVIFSKAWLWLLFPVYLIDFWGWKSYHRSSMPQKDIGNGWLHLNLVKVWSVYAGYTYWESESLVHAIYFIVVPKLKSSILLLWVMLALVKDVDYLLIAKSVAINHLRIRCNCAYNNFMSRLLIVLHEGHDLCHFIDRENCVWNLWDWETRWIQDYGGCTLTEVSNMTESIDH
jgi:hypothetical protein